MITREKLAVVHVAKKELGWDEDLYRDVLEMCAGVRSARDLDDKGFDLVMEYCAERGFKSSGRVRREERRQRKPNGLATPEQLDLIKSNYAKLTWHETARQMGFNKRQCGRSWPQTRAEAIKVIEGQKALLSRLKCDQS